MKPVVILGRGGAGKSALAQRLSYVLDVPVIELDSIFWQLGPDFSLLRCAWQALRRSCITRVRCAGCSTA